MKLFKWSVILLAFLLAGMAMVPMVSASTDSGSADESQGVKQIDAPKGDFVKFFVPEDMQKEIIKGINDSDLAEKEKVALIKTLNEIWTNTSSLTDEEKEKVMTEVSSLLLKGSVGVKWTGYYPWDPNWNHFTLADVHNDMARLAGVKMGLSTTYTDILRNYASEPDTWPGDVAFHYEISGAAGQAESRAISAQNYIKNLGNPTEGYRQLSYAMHYMSDLSNPYHYSPVSLLNHQKYENNVGDNWHSNNNYYNSVNSDGYYYYITDVSAAADNLASVCNQYYSYIDNEVTIDPNNFGNDATLISDTRTCLIYGDRYDTGLVEWANR